MKQLSDIKCRYFSVKLKLKEDVNFKYHHGGKIYKLLAFILEKHPLNSQIVLDLPESGVIHFPAESDYNFGIKLINPSNELTEKIRSKFIKLINRTTTLPNISFRFVLEQFIELPIPEINSDIPNEFTLHIKTPLRMLRRNPSKGEKYFDAECFEPERFFELLQLRIYKDILNVNYKPVTEKPPVCKLISKQLFWIDMPSEGRVNNKVIGGIVGYVKIKTILNQYWKNILTTGQLIHCGNNSAFGFGKYQIKENPFAELIKPAQTIIEKSVSRQNLLKAFQEIKENKGIGGIDNVDLEDYNLNLHENLSLLTSEVVSNNYKPDELLGILLETEKKIRALAIPTIKDRILQKAVSQIISPAIDTLFDDNSYAYRKGLSRKGAAHAIASAYHKGYRYVLESDIDSFFDNVDWEIMDEKLNVIFPEDPVKEFLIKWYKQPVLFNNKQIKRTQGLPQGAVISPVLANLYLDEFDDALKDDYKLIRYADDFVILCKTKEKAEKALEEVKEILERLELKIKDSKTKITSFESGFRYLGYLFVNSLILEADGKRNSKLTAKRKLNEKIPENSWLAQVDFSKIKSLKPDKTGTEIEFQPLFNKDEIEKLPVYITGHKYRVRIDHNYLSISDETNENNVQKIPFTKIECLVIQSNPYVTLSSLVKLAEYNIPVYICSANGKLKTKIDSGKPNYGKWLRQQKIAEDTFFCLTFAQNIINAKINNSLTIAKRTGIKPEIIEDIRKYYKAIPSSKSINELRGIEGKAAVHFFEGIRSLIPVEWNFTVRTKNPPEDPVNTLLSIGYSVLYNHLATAIKTENLNPETGFFHRPAPHHYALASDIQEEFRHIVDALVIYVIKKNIIKTTDFEKNREGKYPCIMKREAKKKYIGLLETRLLTQFSNKQFSGKLNYKQYFHFKAKQITEIVNGNIKEYKTFKVY